MTADTVLIVNPRSGGGRTHRRVQTIDAAARAELDGHRLWLTEHGDHGRELARRAVEEGARLVIAAGGDGTANEVVNGLIEAGADGTVFGLLPRGTGSDLSRTLAMPSEAHAALAAIRDATPRTVDAMRGTFTLKDGTEHVRFGVNVIGVGMAGDVVARVNRGGKRLGGTVSFLSATLGAMLGWRSPEVSLRWGGGPGGDGSWTGRLTNVFVGNGRYCGSGMLTGPGAMLDDGLLDVVIIPHLSAARLVLRTPSLYDGSLPHDPSVEAFRATWMEARPVGPESVPCDVDGEEPGVLPARVEVLPGALQVKAPFASGTLRGGVN